MLAQPSEPAKDGGGDSLEDGGLPLKDDALLEDMKECDAIGALFTMTPLLTDGIGSTSADCHSEESAAPWPMRLLPSVLPPPGSCTIGCGCCARRSIPAPGSWAGIFADASPSLG